MNESMDIYILFLYNFYAIKFLLYEKCGMLQMLRDINSKKENK